MKHEKKETYKAYCIFSDFVICPDNAFEPRFYKRNPYDDYQIETLDGKRAAVEFLCTWRVRGERDEQLIGSLSKSILNMSFERLRSLWIGRLGTIGEYWHYIKLIPLNN